MLHVRPVFGLSIDVEVRKWIRIVDPRFLAEVLPSKEPGLWALVQLIAIRVRQRRDVIVLNLDLLLNEQLRSRSVQI